MEALFMLLEAIDWGPDTIDFLLGFVPEQYRANVESILAIMTTVGLALAAVRKVLEKRAPKLAGSAPVVVLDRLLHVFSANSKPLEERAPVRARLSGAPPPRRSTIPPPPMPPGDEP